MEGEISASEIQTQPAMHLPPDPSAFAVIDGKHRYSVSVAEVELAAEKALIGQFNPRIELVSLGLQPDV